MNAIAQVVYEEMYCHEDGGDVFAHAWADGWDIANPLPVDEWADEYRILPRESSSEHGPWRTNRTPYLREPMQVLSDNHSSKRVVMIFGTQTGKTETGNNWVGASIHQSPSSFMVVQPTVDMGKRWTRQRLNPMVSLTPELSKRIKPSRSRDSGNTATMKEYPGGFMVIAGSNSASSLSSMPVRRLFLDEVDRYPSDVDGEGHPVDIADRRTSSFPRRKVLLTSSPTVKDESVIEEEFKASDQRHYYVPCPHCGHMHVLEDKYLQDDGTFVCPSASGGCGTLIEEHHKTEMLAQGQWIAHNPDSVIPGFHLPSYYAPIGLGYTWKEIADLRKKAKENPEKWKTYVNTIMAETYEDESGKVDWKDLADRAGGYALRTIPRGCLMLTVGVDTQDDRLAVLIIGWGRHEKCWIIDYVELPGDPADEQVWKDLDELLDRPIENSFGIHMKPELFSIDSGGHHTHTVYGYCRENKHLGRLAVKGSRFPGKPVIATRPKPVDLNVAGQVMPGGAELWFVGTDTAKGWLFTRLFADGNPEKTPAPEDRRINFPDGLPDEFYRQLVGERFDATTQLWKKKRGERVEVLDCFVYGFAAANHPKLRIQTLREIDWQRREDIYEPAIRDLFATDEPSTQEPQQESKQPEPKGRQPKNQHNNGFGSDDWCL